MLSKTTYWGLGLGALAVYAIGFGVDVMDVDSAQYASISREMADSGSYLQVYNGGKDYLDKPPLLFWVTAFFFKLFGIGNWSFKIGAFLFTLLGVYSTLRLGTLLYSKKVGQWAALMLLTCQAYFLFNNDLRTDTILTATIIWAIWQLVAWLNTKLWKHLLGATLAIGCAMLAKGPIGLMVPVLAVGSYLVGQSRWRDFLHWQYLLLLLGVGLLISPMLWGLYQQFDQHPEKMVGMVTPQGIQPETNVKGVKFYLWTQSFGRITGENVWKDSSGPFYFVHNFLWSFLPWAPLFFVALFARLRSVVIAFMQKQAQPEWLTLGGFILPFLVLSTSKFKLPHYIFVLYPLAAILLASWLGKALENKAVKRSAIGTQGLVFLISTGLIGMIYVWFFPDYPIWKLAVSFGLLALAIAAFSKQETPVAKYLVTSVLISLAVNFTMNGWFYPNLMNYQTGTVLSRAVDENDINPDDVYRYHFTAYSLSFGLQKVVPQAHNPEIEQLLNDDKDVYLVTRAPYYEKLKEQYVVQTVHEFGSHSVTLLHIKFLNPATRPERLKPTYLVKVIGRK